MYGNHNNILQLPMKCLLERRLTKAFFLRNFTLTSSEKKILNTSVQSMQWLASLKPSTTNIPPYKTDPYTFEEIQVFIVRLLGDGDFEQLYKKVSELIHKYIPYQIFLIIEAENMLLYSVCDKRINQADQSKRTIESYQYTPIINTLYKREIEVNFMEALHFEVLDKTNLQTTYQSYVQSIIQYTSACITGSYHKRSKARTEEDLQILKEIDQLESDIVSLKSQIKKEKHFNRKTKLNIDLQQKRSTIQELQNKLNEK